MRCRLTSVSASFLLVLSLASAARCEPTSDDMAKVQGRWTRDVFGPAGEKTGRAVKEITGNHETITLYDLEDRITHRHKVEFKLEMAGQVKLFTFTNLEVTDGTDKGRKTPGPISYIYRVDARQFVEAWGFLPGQENHPAELYTWSRAKAGASTGFRSRLPGQNTGLAASPSPPRPERLRDKARQSATVLRVNRFLLSFFCLRLGRPQAII